MPLPDALYRLDAAAPPYLAYFGLSEPPFGLTPDTQFLCATQSHREAINTLLVALSSGEGFLKIVGEVGTGKTLLCRRLLKTLAGEARTAYIPNPQLSPDELLLALAEEFGLSADAAEGGNAQRIRTLNAALLDNAQAGQRVVVLIDEAQALPLESLETLRLLSNLETEKRKLMQIVLFGQPELDTHLNDPSIRQLKQRIAFSYRLGTLSVTELPVYLAQRLKVAGAPLEGELFSPAACRLLHKASKGTPRLVNILANKALMAAFGQGHPRIEPRHVRAAIEDTEGVKLPFWW
ncbi:MAG: AAA family ATPase [Zoogloeaceae bacterium]|jgi:MSHA biogenesis protein MshM|nr:AAA family ATPase [Zoogloeaceae bacterium]